MHCCCGTAISITYCECVFVALVIHHAMHMRHIILSPVACPVFGVQQSLINGTIFGGGGEGKVNRT